MRRALPPVLVAGAVLAGLAAAGCGQPSADLFVVERSGSVPGAKLSMLVGDGGQVECNGGRRLDYPSDLLIEAREIARELNGDEKQPGPAAGGLRLPPGPGSILSYEVRSEKGTVAFSDTSAGQPEVFFRVAKLTRDLAKKVCGLPR